MVTSYGPSDLDTFLVLSLNISGFRGEPTGSEGMPVVLGHISVEFEIGCKGKCELMFLMVSLWCTNITQIINASLM